MRKNRITATGALALLAGLPLACTGDAGSATTWSGAVDTLPDGRVLVRNDAPEWADDMVPTFEEEIRIVSMLGEGPETLGEVRDLLVDEENRIYVLESQV